MKQVGLVGIVNLTPDSFSDGGKLPGPEIAVEYIGKMIAEGASVIDIGAESTRPGAVLISPSEEWRRLGPVLEQLPKVKSKNVAISVDTRHAETARKALDLGVDWINDVTGFVSSAMVEVVKPSKCKLVVMHSLGVPANKAITIPPAADVVETLTAWGKDRVAKLEEKGIDKSRIIFDPGVGFGKSEPQSFTVLRNIAAFKSLGVPVFVGHSRKSFLARFTSSQPALRDDATLAASLFLAQQGVDYLRVHEIARHVQMLNAWNAIAYDEQQQNYRRSA